MAKVLVTGGAGFVGAALVRALLQKNEEVRVLARKSSDLSNLDGLPIEISFGDVYYPASLRNAMKGVDIVYHTAAVYQFFPWWKRKAAPIHKINIEGTKNVLASAKQAGIKRLVYTSSIITIGKNKKGELSDENTPFSQDQLSSHYARSKVGAESIVLEEARKGFPAVVVNPGIVLGERDSKPTPSGEVIVKFLNRIYPGYFDTIWCVADVDDVAQGHIAACERGRIGERYILCHKEHYSMKELFKILERLTGVGAPFVKFPYPLLLAFTYIDEWTIQWVRHRPLLASEGVKFCHNFLRCDNSKAVQELGYKTTPFEKTLEKAVRWYKDHGYVRR